MAEQRVPRIFIAEDDESILDLLVTRLRIAGYHTTQEKDGLAALEAIKRAPPNACILDVNMPRMDGFELIRRIRQHQRLSTTPIVVVSADTDPDTPERISQLGVSAYFSKPYSPAQVRRKLEQILNASTP